MTLHTILDPLVGLVDTAMKSKKGDSFAALRVTREALRAINDVLGQPICSAEERAQRRLDRLGPVPPPPSVFRRNAPPEGTAM